MRELETGSRPVTWFAVFVGLLACVYYYNFFFHRAHVELEIVVNERATFKLYWSPGNRQFSERHQVAVRVLPGKENYSFFLTSLSTIAELRIDPLERPGKIIIKKIVVHQPGFEPVIVDLASASPLNDIGEIRYDAGGLWMEATGPDPYLLAVPDIRRSPVNWLAEVARYVLLCCVVVLVIGVVGRFRHQYAYIPIMLGLVFTLVVTMAAISDKNAHPDEYVHLKATGYYKDHWLPPQVDDPAIRDTYSPYGVSRLNNGEVYYLFAGKIAKIAESLYLSDAFSARLLNVLFFGFIVLYAIYSVEVRLVALPFLLSPEIWYLFSYCASDAFGLFVCFLAACEVVRSDSCLNRLLFGGHRSGAFATWLYLPALLALLILIKINFYPFVGFLGCVVLWRIYKELIPTERKSAVVKLAIILGVALVFAALRVGADYYVNGLDRDERLAVVQEQTADALHKPSTELSQKHPGMHLKDRGVTLQDMIYGYRWLGHSLHTAIGIYGYFTIAAPQEYYSFFTWVWAVFLMYLVARLMVSGNGEDRSFTLLVLLLAAGLISVSLYRSWTIDFQAQGRYIFTVLPMIGILLGRSRDLFDNRIFILGVSHLFLLGLYSFIFVALARIPRLPW